MADLPNTSYNGGDNADIKSAFANARDAISRRFAAKAAATPSASTAPTAPALKKKGWKQVTGIPKPRWEPTGQPLGGIPYASPLLDPSQPQYLAPQSWQNLETGEIIQSSVPPDYQTAPGTSGPGGYSDASDPKNLRFRNLPDSLGGGQYVIDVTKPGEVIRSKRGVRPDLYDEGSKISYPSATASEENRKMLGGIRPGQGTSGPGMQIDHVVPLWLGGGDNPENKQLLTPAENYKKTKIQAVALTLMHADKPEDRISTAQAKMMALRWKELDPDGVGEVISDGPKAGQVEIGNAKAMSKKWLDQSTKVQYRWQDVFKEMKNLKDFGEKTFGSSAPAAFVREFAKAGATSATFEYAPYEMDDDYKSGAAKVAAWAGATGGTLAGFILPLKLLGAVGGLMAVGLGKIPFLARAAAQIGHGSKLVKTAGLAKTVAEATELGIKAGRAITQNTKLMMALKSAGLFTTYGQLSREGLLGGAISGEDTHWGQRFITDAVLGGAMGGWSNHSKPVAEAVKVATVALTLDVVMRADEPGWTMQSSVAQMLTMGGLHYLFMRRPGMAPLVHTPESVTTMKVGQRIGAAIRTAQTASAKYNPLARKAIEPAYKDHEGGINSEQMQKDIDIAVAEMNKILTANGETPNVEVGTNQYIKNLFAAREAYIRDLSADRPVNEKTGKLMASEQDIARGNDLLSIIKSSYKVQSNEQRLNTLWDTMGNDPFTPAITTKNPRVNLSNIRNSREEYDQLLKESPGVMRIPLSGTEGSAEIRANVEEAKQAGALMGRQGFAVRDEIKGVQTGASYKYPEHYIEAWFPKFYDAEHTRFEKFLHLGNFSEESHIRDFGGPNLTPFESATANKDKIGLNMKNSGEDIRLIDLEYLEEATGRKDVVTGEATHAVVIQMHADSPQLSRPFNEAWQQEVTKRVETMNLEADTVERGILVMDGTIAVDWFDSIAWDFKRALIKGDFSEINKKWGKNTVTPDTAKKILTNEDFSIRDMFEVLKMSPEWNKSKSLYDSQLKVTPGTDVATAKALDGYLSTGVRNISEKAIEKVKEPAKEQKADDGDFQPVEFVPTEQIEQPKPPEDLGLSDEDIFKLLTDVGLTPPPLSQMPGAGKVTAAVSRAKTKSKKPKAAVGVAETVRAVKPKTRKAVTLGGEDGVFMPEKASKLRQDARKVIIRETAHKERKNAQKGKTAEKTPRGKAVRETIDSSLSEKLTDKVVIDEKGVAPSDSDFSFSKRMNGGYNSYYDKKADKIHISSDVNPEDAHKYILHEFVHRGLWRMAEDLGGTGELHKVLLSAKTELFKAQKELLVGTGHESLDGLKESYKMGDGVDAEIRLLSELAGRWAERFAKTPQKSPPTWWGQMLENLQNWIKKYTGIELDKKGVDRLVSSFVEYGKTDLPRSRVTPEAPVAGLPTASPQVMEARQSFVGKVFAKDRVSGPNATAQQLLNTIPNQTNFEAWVTLDNGKRVRPMTGFSSASLVPGTIQIYGGNAIKPEGIAKIEIDGKVIWEKGATTPTPITQTGQKTGEVVKKPEGPKPAPQDGWARRDPNGYEVSTKGDVRFSAFSAKLKDGRSIEEAYQVGVKGYSSWREGKGKAPKTEMTREEQYKQYKALWEQWAKENPQMIEELRAKSAGKPLTDMFANSDINQARALSEILKESPTPTKPEIIKYKGYNVLDVGKMKSRDDGHTKARLLGDKNISIDEALIKKTYELKGWVNVGRTLPNGKVEIFKREPLPADTFSSLDDYRNFLIEHEIAHDSKEGQTRAGEKQGDYVYESRINRLALEAVGKKAPDGPIVEPKTPHDKATAGGEIVIPKPKGEELGEESTEYRDQETGLMVKVEPMFADGSGQRPDWSSETLEEMQQHLDRARAAAEVRERNISPAMKEKRIARDNKLAQKANEAEWVKLEKNKSSLPKMWRNFSGWGTGNTPVLNAIKLYTNDPAVWRRYDRARVIEMAKRHAGGGEDRAALVSGWEKFRAEIEKDIAESREEPGWKIHNSEELRGLHAGYDSFARENVRKVFSRGEDSVITFIDAKPENMGKTEAMRRKYVRENGFPEYLGEIVEVSKNSWYPRESRTGVDRLDLNVRDLAKNGYLPIGFTSKGGEYLLGVRFSRKLVEKFDNMMKNDPARARELYLTEGETFKPEGDMSGEADKFYRVYDVDILRLPKGIAGSDLNKRANAIHNRYDAYTGKDFNTEVPLLIIQSKKIGNSADIKSEYFEGGDEKRNQETIGSFVELPEFDGPMFIGEDRLPQLTRGLNYDQAKYESGAKFLIDAEINIPGYSGRTIHKGHFERLGPALRAYLKETYGLRDDQMGRDAMITVDQNEKIGPKSYDSIGNGNAQREITIKLGDIYGADVNAGTNAGRATSSFMRKLPNDPGVLDDMLAKTGENRAPYEEFNKRIEESSTREELQKVINDFKDQFHFSEEDLLYGDAAETFRLGGAKIAAQTQIGKLLKRMFPDRVLYPELHNSSRAFYSPSIPTPIDGLGTKPRHVNNQELMIGEKMMKKRGLTEGDWVVVVRDPSIYLNNVLVLKVVNGDRVGRTGLGSENAVMSQFNARIKTEADYDGDLMLIMKVGEKGLPESYKKAILRGGQKAIPIMPAKAGPKVPATFESLMKSMRSQAIGDDQTNHIAEINRIMDATIANNIKIRIEKSPGGKERSYFEVLSGDTVIESGYTTGTKNEGVFKPMWGHKERVTLLQTLQYAVDSKGSPDIGIRVGANAENPGGEKTWMLRQLFRDISGAKKKGETSEMDIYQARALDGALETVQMPWTLEKSIEGSVDLQQAIRGSKPRMGKDGLMRLGNKQGLNPWIEQMKAMKAGGEGETTPFQENLLSLVDIRTHNLEDSFLINSDKAAGEAVKEALKTGKIPQFGPDSIGVQEIKALAEMAKQFSLRKAKAADGEGKATFADMKKLEAKQTALREDLKKYFRKNNENGQYTEDDLRNLSFWAATTFEGNRKHGYMGYGNNVQRPYKSPIGVARYDAIINADPQISEIYNRTREAFREEPTAPSGDTLAGEPLDTGPQVPQDWRVEPMPEEDAVPASERVQQAEEGANFDNVEEMPQFQLDSSMPQMAHKAFENIKENIRRRTGVNTRYINDPKQNWAAQYQNGNIVINKAYAKADTPWHEVAHPIIDVVHSENPELFKSLKTELDAEGNILKEVREKYKKASKTEDDLYKEAIVTAIGRDAAGKIDLKTGKGLIDAIKKLLGKIKDYLNKTFGTGNEAIKLENLRGNLSYKDIANLLVFDKRRIELKNTKGYENLSEKTDSVLGVNTLNKTREKYKYPKREYKPSAKNYAELALVNHTGPNNHLLNRYYGLQHNVLTNAQGRNNRGVMERFKPYRYITEPTKFFSYSQEKQAHPLNPIKNVAVPEAEPTIPTLNFTDYLDKRIAGKNEQAKVIPLNDVVSFKDASKEEKAILSDFLVQLKEKFPSQGSMKAEQMKEQLQRFMEDNHQYFFEQLHGYELRGMDAVFPGLNPYDSSWAAKTSMRIVLVRKDFMNVGHRFSLLPPGTRPRNELEALEENGRLGIPEEMSGNGLGWYVEFRDPEKGFTYYHEIQSDILPDLQKKFYELGIDPFAPFSELSELTLEKLDPSFVERKKAFQQNQSPVVNGETPEIRSYRHDWEVFSARRRDNFEDHTKQIPLEKIVGGIRKGAQFKGDSSIANLMFFSENQDGNLIRNPHEAIRVSEMTPEQQLNYIKEDVMPILRDEIPLRLENMRDSKKRMLQSINEIRREIVETPKAEAENPDLGTNVPEDEMFDFGGPPRVVKRRRGLLYKQLNGLKKNLNRLQLEMSGVARVVKNLKEEPEKVEEAVKWYLNELTRRMKFVVPRAKANIENSREELYALENEEGQVVAANINKAIKDRLKLAPKGENENKLLPKEVAAVAEAKRILTMADKWFETMAIHAMNRAYDRGDNVVYFNSGASSALEQGNSMASSLYLTPNEATRLNTILGENGGKNLVHGSEEKNFLDLMNSMIYSRKKNRQEAMKTYPDKIFSDQWQAGKFWTTLKSLEKFGIVVSVEMPAFSKVPLIKVDMTNYDPREALTFKTQRPKKGIKFGEKKYQNLWEQLNAKRLESGPKGKVVPKYKYDEIGDTEAERDDGFDTIF